MLKNLFVMMKLISNKFNRIYLYTKHLYSNVFLNKSLMLTKVDLKKKKSNYSETKLYCEIITTENASFPFRVYKSYL